METALDCDCSSKVCSTSHRRILARFVQCEIPLSLMSLKFLFGYTVRVILLCQLVHLEALLLGPANFELRFTIDLVSKITIVNSFPMFFLAVDFFAASVPRVAGDMVLFLCFSFAVPSTMESPLLDHVVRVVRAPSLSLLNFLLDSLSTKKCPQVQ